MTAQQGNTVKVHYTGTLKEDGSQFDSSEGREPLEFKLGDGMVIAGFERAVLGKSVGDVVDVEIPPEEGYGMPNDELKFEVRTEQIPPEITLEKGLTLQVPLENGQPAIVHVSEWNDEVVTLDGNHPLAGKTLCFNIKVVEIA